MNKNDTSTRIDICYIVSHGFAARMVLQTGLLKRLVQGGKRVAIITPDADDPNIKAECEASNIELYEYTGSGKRWSSQYLRMRKYFLEDIESNVALMEKYRYVIAKERNYPKRYLMNRLGFAAYRLNKTFPFIRRRFQKREKKYIQSDKATQFLQKINPRLLVSTYPVSLIEGVLLNAAQQLNIQTTIHLLSWDNISCKGHFPALADKYIAWGPIMAEEFEEYYDVPQKNIYQCGVPHFDAHIEVKNNLNVKPFIEKLGLNPEKPYLFFAMSAPRFCPQEIDVVEWISQSIEDNPFGEDMQFIARPHPRNVVGYMADQTWLARLDKLISKRVKIDYPQPVILPAFDPVEPLDYWFSARRMMDFPHLKKFTSYGGAVITHDLEQLEHQLKRYINDPKADWELRQKTRHMQCGENEALENIMSE